MRFWGLSVSKNSCAGLLRDPVALPTASRMANFLSLRKQSDQRHSRVLPERAVIISYQDVTRHESQERGFGSKIMKVSAPNVFEGTVKEIKEGATTAHVLIDVKGLTVTASITNESVEELRLHVGGKVKAIIKSSDVIVGVE